MLNPKTNERELAYVVEVSETKELPGYDKVHYVHILGWWCVASKDLTTGDKGIYFEIDSVLPRDDPRFAFMEKRNYRVKTQKMCKVVSQGLVLPLSEFKEFKNANIGDFLTQALNVKLFEEPSPAEMPKSKSNAFTKAMDRHRKFFNFPLVKWMLRFRWFRALCAFFLVKKKDKIKWPEWLPKTNSERVQNIPSLFENKSAEWILTEKVDGMSSSYILDEKGNYLVCSHNVVVYSSAVKGSEKIADGSDYVKTNVWLEMSDKYSILDKLIALKDKYHLSHVAIQGETYGDGIQKRNYSKKNREHDFVVFHVWFNSVRIPIKEMVSACEDIGLPHVGVFDWNYHLPDTVDDMINYVDSKKSFIDNGQIEGFVMYSQDGSQNYKCVSPSFLLKYH